jgi:hypothetical protein
MHVDKDTSGTCSAHGRHVRALHQGSRQSMM